MDEYVSVEAYEVGLDSGYASTGSAADRVSDATGSSTATWDLATGITGKGWDLLYFDWGDGTVKTYNCYGTTHEEVAQKTVYYLNNYGGAYVASRGCS